jgi:hypothetical protein
MSERPTMPERPARPSKPEQLIRTKSSLWIRIFVWFGFGVVALLVVPLILFGIHPIIGAIYLAIILLGPIAAFHYFVWGRWIGDTIRKEVAEEEAREAIEAQERNNSRAE